MKLIIKTLFFFFLTFSSFGLFAERVAPSGNEFKDLDKLSDSKLDAKCPCGNNKFKLIPGTRAYPTRCGELPNETEICQKCLYIYDREGKFWERESANKSEFKIPFSKLISLMPVPDADLLTRSRYRQKWKENIVIDEYMEIETKESFVEVVDKIKAYIKKEETKNIVHIEKELKCRFTGSWLDFDIQSNIFENEEKGLSKTVIFAIGLEKIKTEKKK